MINILNRTAYVLLGILLLMIAPFLIPKVIGFIPYAVLTDSMEPAYSVGSLIYVKESAPETIQVGDVITFRLDVKSGQLATHRVVANNTKDKEFITKGDHNDYQDAAGVAYERLIGRVAGSVPVLGYLYSFLVSSTGIALETFIVAMIYKSLLATCVYINKEKSLQAKEMNIIFAIVSKVYRYARNRKQKSLMRYVFIGL